MAGVGGMHRRGGACVAGGAHGKGVCNAWGMHGKGECVAKGVVCGKGVHGRRDGHCSRRSAYYWNTFFLLAATKLGQGNVFTGVCDSVHWGVCLSAPPGQVHPPRQVHPPWAGTPGQVHPLAGITPRQVHPPDRYPPRQVQPPGQVHPPRQVHPPAGTHPTGMHSCFIVY